MKFKNLIQFNGHNVYHITDKIWDQAAKSNKELLKHFFETKDVTRVIHCIHDDTRQHVHTKYTIKDSSSDLQKIMESPFGKMFTEDMKKEMCKRIQKTKFISMISFVDGKQVGEVELMVDYDEETKLPATYAEKPPPQEFIDHVAIVMGVEVFLQFAEIETKIVPAKSEIKEGFNVAYSNRTNQPYIVVDSTWFTNLIVSGAFKVRGHFRLQACGEKMQQRKLIWINEFEKHGYTREAKKIKDDPTSTEIKLNN